MNSIRTSKFQSRLITSAFVWLIGILGVTSSFGAEKKFRFIAGLTYVSGLNELKDAIEANHPVAIDVLWPVGLSLRGEYEVAPGFAIGAGIGPAVLVFGDASFSVIPIGADLVYSFPTRNNTRPYIRAGFQQPLVSGDYLDGGSAGLNGGVGIEFGRTKLFGWGLDLGYNGSKVGVTTFRGSTIDVESYGATASVFFRF